MERKSASDYPQELLDLFHEYQHGDITRRSFLDRAGKFAVGGLTVAAIFESLKPNYAWAQQVPPDDKRIKVGYETVQSPPGPVPSKVIWRARQRKLPVVLVIHENRGLNKYIEDGASPRARQFHRLRAGWINFGRRLSATMRRWGCLSQSTETR